MKLETIESVRLISNFSPIVPLIFYVRSLQEQSPLQNHIIAVIVVMSGSVDLVTFFAATPSLSNAYEVIHFFLATWFFYCLVYKKRSEPILLIGIGVYVSVLIYSVCMHGLFTYYIGLWSIGSVIIIVHAVVYFVNVSSMVVDRYFDSNLYSNIIFVVSISASAFVLALLLDTTLSIGDVIGANILWSIHNVFNIMKNLGFAFAFYYTGKRKIYMNMQQLEKIARQLEEEGDTE